MDHEVVIWLFQQLISMLQFNLNILVTDEDSAYLPALKDFKAMHPNIEIKHILCAEHKIKNFEIKLQKTSLTKNKKQIARNLFYKICYSDSELVVDQSIKGLFDLDDFQLKKYMQKHIIPSLCKFSYAKIKKFWNGINTTSIAESRNRMIKKRLTRKNSYHLLDMCKEINSIDENARMCFQQKLFRTRLNLNNYKNFVFSTVSPKIYKEIQHSRDNLDEYDIFSNENGSFGCYHCESKNNIFTIRNNSCSYSAFQVY